MISCQCKACLMMFVTSPLPLLPLSLGRFLVLHLFPFQELKLILEMILTQSHPFSNQENGNIK